MTLSAARQARLKLARRGLWSSLLLVATMLPLGGVGFWLVDPKVHSIGEGMWLAFVTAATVGYGDVVPSNGAARFFAMVVVLVGLAVLSLVTASLSTIFIQKHADDDLLAQQMAADARLEHAMLAELQQLRAQVAALQVAVERLSAVHERPG
ncbi:potassium channel family protein [Ottowia sp.]|uniref:potassium channel family protein n=1 Tax=Ottowia sp. TaxID=1898956 RepID=UPI003A8C4F3C